MAENPHQGEVLQKLNAIQDALYFGMGLELHASGLLGGMVGIEYVPVSERSPTMRLLLLDHRNDSFHSVFWAPYDVLLGDFTLAVPKGSITRGASNVLAQMTTSLQRHERLVLPSDDVVWTHQLLWQILPESAVLSFGRMYDQPPVIGAAKDKSRNWIEQMIQEHSLLDALFARALEFLPEAENRS